MLLRKFTFIGLRLLAVYIFLQALLHLARVINFYVLPVFYENLVTEQEAWINVLLNIAPFLVLLVFSIVLWLFADRFTSFFILDEDQDYDVKKLQMDTNAFQVIAFSVIGLFMIVHTLPQFFMLIPTWLQLNEVGEHIHPSYKYELWFGVTEKVVRLMLGVGLLLGSRGLAGLLRKIREI
ncbi:hypothetical protein H1D32_02290 [Anaerobacillus sp. CMMVII]|uniref:hypothetical protein n=1 Tax=Anaerobacillus sp. CMMVII TaxID=2755588 RepID=UPI0021B7E0EF|nr:hypothetical protein [Anaerobacillus sp. CMMVII]MCT8136678.1 hypothetical protein [Anaerobacillus sp. CMMVII]